MMTNSMKGKELMSNGARAWTRAGRFLHHRPFQFICYLLAAVALVVVLMISFITSNENAADIEEIQNAFCRGNAAYTVDQERRCQMLLDQLLKNPTPEQARRLREIVEETR